MPDTWFGHQLLNFWIFCQKKRDKQKKIKKNFSENFETIFTITPTKWSKNEKK